MSVLSNVYACIQKVSDPLQLDDCELPCRYWKQSLDLLQEQQGLLTTEASLQPLQFVFKSEFEQKNFEAISLNIFITNSIS